MSRPESYAVFWGCLIQLRLPWIEVAARRVLPKLGIRIVDLPFGCCPDPIAAKATDTDIWLTLAARNITLAEEEDLNILAMCSGCYESLKLARHELKSKEKQAAVNGWLKPFGKKYEGSTDIVHMQEWLINSIGVERIASMVQRPLKGFAATHTGCHFTRPPAILKTDHPIYPEQLDHLCEAIGLLPVEYPDKVLCCGAGGGLTDKNVPANMVKRKLNGARKGGADCIVAHCPACIQVLDRGQNIHSKEDQDVALPVLHILELIGLAMGLPESKMAFQAHHVPVKHTF